MSLINDALKRAKENQPATTPAPEPDKPMQPAEPGGDQPGKGGLPPYFIPAALVVLCGACWFLIQGWESKRQAGIYPEPVVIHAREAVQDPVPTQEPARAPTADELKQFGVDPAALGAAPVSASATSAAATPGPSTTASPGATAAAPAAPVRSRPAFKLQGIFYRVTNPSAMVNSRMVSVGDVVDDAKVKSIDRQSVTLIHDGQTQVLTLY